MKEDALELAKTWANNSYFDRVDRDYLKRLIEKAPEDSEELVESFHKELEFGTGGLRAIIGIGSNRINKYNIRKAAQAMANIAHNKNNSKGESLRVAISYDCRRFSFEFAKTCAEVFAANGVHSYIFKKLTPTPLLSYAVRYFNATCGVMITASHNPKEYNGLKAYWEDGAQVTPPVDQEIINAYKSISDWSEIKVMNFEKAQDSGLISWIDDELQESFFKVIEATLPNTALSKNHGDKVSFVYTPLNGTGHLPCKEISERLGYKNFHLIKEQALPDGTFKTIESTPNPEDPIALKLAVNEMLAGNHDVAYGTDPDCDRLGVVVNHENSAHYLNGNQIAFLMLHYLLSVKKEKNTLPDNFIVLKSIVTSPLQETIVSHYDGKIYNTLTGFKWMAQKLSELEKNGEDFSFLFASEESFGYMPHAQVRDKDAVAALALMNEITLYYKLQDKTLIDALDDIYELYGYAHEGLIAKTYKGISGAQKIERIMNFFRNDKISIEGETVAIKQDFDSLLTYNLKDNTQASIDMHRSNVIGLEFESGNRLFIRPSGTEPKIKFYTMAQSKDGNLKEKKESVRSMIDNIESYINTKLQEL